MVATEDMRVLREYVTAPSSGSQQQAESTVVLHVTHSNLKLQMMELRFDLHVSNLELSITSNLRLHALIFVGHADLSQRTQRKAEHPLWNQPTCHGSPASGQLRTGASSFARRLQAARLLLTV